MVCRSRLLCLSVFFASFFLYSSVATSFGFPKFGSGNQERVNAEKARIYDAFKMQLATFNGKHNLYRNIPFVRDDIANAMPSTFPEPEIELIGFAKVVADMFSLIATEPSLLRTMPLDELASLFKQTMMFASDEQFVETYLSNFFGTDFREIFFSYLVVKTNENESYLKAFHTDPEQFREHLFYEFLRRENDIIYISAFANSMVKMAESKTPSAAVSEKKFEDLAMQSSLRIVLAVSLFTQKNPKAIEIIHNMLNEDNREQNQAGAIDFDYYGRYGQAGDVTTRFLRFCQALQAPDWQKTNEIFDAILQHAHRTLAIDDYRLFLRKLRQPLKLDGQVSGYQILLSRENFAANYQIEGY